MRIADIGATLELRQSTIENAITIEELARDYNVTPEAIGAVMQTGNQAGWLCEAAGRVLGFAMGERSSGEVVVVAVHPDCERRGIGGAVLSRVQDWLFAVGHHRLWLRANPDPALRASGFYRRFGWVDSGRMLAGDIVLELPRSVWMAVCYDPAGTIRCAGAHPQALIGPSACVTRR